MKQSFSPRELGRALGVSESSLKRWADEGRIHVSRTAGGHRRIMLDEAIRFIRQARLPVIRPEVLGLAVQADMQPGDLCRRRPDETLYESLRRGLAGQARGQILSMYLQGTPVDQLCDQLIAPAMHRIGELWNHDRGGIYIEHRASDICVQTLAQLRTLMVEPEPGAPLAIGATPTGDPYILPCMMSAAVLAAQGYRQINLGPDMPIDVLLQAARSHQADLVWLSVSVNHLGDELVKAVDGLARNLESFNARLIVGGRAWPMLHPMSPGNALAARSMGELAAYARGLLAGDGARETSKAPRHPRGHR